ncbi:MAG: sigma-70 family RNA polymerase sigma factor [Oscillospiraceae bacterium]|nr:sigma-70 family RNA polymerase sigma factor [Oscillospiraceae bacterium]
MDDESIVALYWARNEAAIAESAKKYGAYCTSIARNILQSRSDAEECVNDTWLRAWNAMPPDKPSVLAAFLGRITRNLSFDVYKRQRREKRGGTGVDAVLDELAECVSGLEDTERQWTQRELREEIDRFLLALSEEKRCIFILRYWYADSVSDIARQVGRSADQISVSLHRIRAKLKAHLIEKGFDV